MADFNSTLDYLRKLCSAREYCKADVMAKARKRLEDESDVIKAINTLEADGYLDESRYAAAFARDKSALSGWGRIKIRYALNAKGIDKDVIDAALSEIDEEKATEKLNRTLAAKYDSLKEDPQMRLKLLKFALSRGFDYEETDVAIKKIIRK